MCLLGQGQQDMKLNSNQPEHDYENIWEDMMCQQEQAVEIQTSECVAYASVLAWEKEIQTVQNAYASELEQHNYD